jgi:hypothetical protein
MSKGLEMKNILKFDTEKQLQKIREFIEDCINIIENSEIVRLMRK